MLNPFKQIAGSITYAISAVLFLLANILRSVAEMCKKIADSCFNDKE
jgi:hypothetical protein